MERTLKHLDADNCPIHISFDVDGIDPLYAPGTGNFTRSFNFTFNSDATTDGQATYYIRVENASGTLLFPQQGPFTSQYHLRIVYLEMQAA